MLLALILMIASAALQSQSPAVVRLLETGSFHRDEVPPDANGTWAALVMGEDDLRVVPVTVTVRREHDPLLDDEGEMTGMRVDVAPPVDPVVLVGGMKVAEGPLPTAMMNRVIDPGAPLRVTFGSGLYEFSTACGERTVVSDQEQTDCRLLLVAGPKRRILAKYNAYFSNGTMIWSGDDGPRVIWAGDLDGDGALDVLLDTSDHYNVREKTLYLSSFGSEAEPVGRAASFTETGC